MPRRFEGIINMNYILPKIKDWLPLGSLVTEYFFDPSQKKWVVFYKHNEKEFKTRLKLSNK